MPAYFNFNHAPTHLIGLRSKDLKFGIYANWANGTATIVDDGTLETEFYDFATPAGIAELHNLKHDPRIPALRRALLDDIISTELRARLPGALGLAQDVAKLQYLAYDALIRNVSPQDNKELHAVLPFGVDF